MLETEIERTINEIFHTSYEYKVVTYDKLEITSRELKFELEVRVNVSDKDRVDEFLQQFYTSVGCTFNIQAGRQDKASDGISARSKIRGFRKCSMNVCGLKGKENRQPGKNTNCQSKLNFRLENPKAKHLDEKHIKE